MVLPCRSRPGRQMISSIVLPERTIDQGVSFLVHTRKGQTLIEYGPVCAARRSCGEFVAVVWAA
jgi:hypothetical protein